MAAEPLDCGGTLGRRRSPWTAAAPSDGGARRLQMPAAGIATTSSSGGAHVDKGHPQLEEAKLNSGDASSSSSTASEADTDITSSSSSPAPKMDPRLLKAAASGNTKSMQDMASQDPSVLLGRTEAGNTCLHISSTRGHQGFCMAVLALNPSLLTAVNEDVETPLLRAVKCGHVSLASELLSSCLRQQLSEAILTADSNGCNALHFAIRSSYRELALDLIEAKPDLSKAVNKYGESPMFIAVMRNFTDVFEELLEISDSAHVGPAGQNVLHAAVAKGNPGIAKRIMEARSWLAREPDDARCPTYKAASEGKVEVLKVLLEHDRSLGCLLANDNDPLLNTAASEGHVGVARELLDHCPDAPYYNKTTGQTCLHVAVSSDRKEYVQFILGSPQLRMLVNMQDEDGQTALHLAAKKRNQKMVAALLSHPAIDVTVYNKKGDLASRLLSDAFKKSKGKPNIWITDGTATTGSSGSTRMDKRLLKAAAAGYTAEMENMVRDDPGVLLGTDPQGNTCLHIASAHGHQGFCKYIIEEQNQSHLLNTVNSDGETPLVTAVTRGHVSLASFLLRCCLDRHLTEAILKQDKHGCNALHHAVRCRHKTLALELIQVEPDLSKAVNKYDESPMFIAVMRNFEDVFEKLLGAPDSAHGGTYGCNALHAAVRNDNSVIAKRIVESRPALATEENREHVSPMSLAITEDKISVLKVLLEHDSFLGYVVATDGSPLLAAAAYRNRVNAAQELLKHCPGAPCSARDGTSCLHTAVHHGQAEFVEFVVQSEQLRKLINRRDKEGHTALYYAALKCNPKIFTTLLYHQDTDVTTMLEDSGNPAIWVPSIVDQAHAQTLNWNEVSMLMLKANPEGAGAIYNLHNSIKAAVIEKTRKDIRSLTQIYTGNTSLVAILISTITFAAAFTLPGGYSSDAGSQGLPVMGRSLAFKAFLISDTLAMCSSFTVAFLCIIARWEDPEFLLYYRSFTKKLMWFAYVATTTAFATGLYTVLAPHLKLLAIAICVVSILLPFITKLVGEWPIHKLKFRLGKTFKSDLLDMI